MKLITIKTLTLILASISLTALASAAHHGDSHKQKNIVEVATSAGVFKTLVAAVTAADLASTLQGEGPSPSPSKMATCSSTTPKSLKPT